MPRNIFNAISKIYSIEEWRTALLLFLSYVGVYSAASHFLPPSSLLNPASAIALASMYFGGIRLWPAVFITGLTAQMLTGAPALHALGFPILETLQAAAGSHLLHTARIDPLFRRHRDAFYFIATVLIISFISPTLSLIIAALNGTALTEALWWHGYLDVLVLFLIETPFMLRWLTKPRFSRTPQEVAETVAVFVALLLLNFAYFTRGIPTLFTVPIVYLILLPMFWIALKLRPRFVTLALLITAFFALSSALATDSILVLPKLMQSELFLIALSISFFIITTLEEDRRVNTNLMRSQLGTLKNAVARVSSESKAKNDFIAILAHELRNPLAPVVSAIDLLKLKGPRDADDAGILDMMEDRMGVVRRLLDDLLDISRISEGKITLKKDTLNLEPVLRQAAVSTDHHRKELHQRLAFKVPKKPLYILGDSIRLEQVFSNLLTNASKYSSSGDTISLSLRENDGIAEIEIADKGIGLDPNELDIIFLPFHQVEHGERSKKGLGIGLSLVHNFVQMHGGSIEAKSDGPGTGSKFITRLPMLFPKDASVKDGAKISAAQQPVRNTKGPLVLIVDDNDAAGGGIGRLLEFEGCTVAYAYDGKQAIEKVRRLKPDVVLLDIGLPDMDGYAVAKILREQGFEGRLIALTGYTMDSSKKLGKEGGFEFYLVKPASLADLRRVLADAR